MQDEVMDLTLKDEADDPSQHTTAAVRRRQVASFSVERGKRVEKETRGVRDAALCFAQERTRQILNWAG